VSDDQNTLKAGPRGPSLLEDLYFREKITHFDHERIPENSPIRKNERRRPHFSEHIGCGFVPGSTIKARVAS
jgi:hypothetical protein